ncbi:hypothetical protein SDC9_203896 [bioreactor metagenome]|uniref:Uncharacterized protein n=1 Tax=bioreactor metagenome TaxID=1076179 RepID=A0A645IZ78_9ZZZZ
MDIDAAEQKDGHRRAVHGELEAGNVELGQMVRLVGRNFKRVVCRAELFALVLATHERFDRAYGRQVLLHDRVELVEHALHAAVNRRELFEYER